GLVPIRQQGFSYRRSTLDGQRFTACRSYSHRDSCSSGSRPLGRYYPELLRGRTFRFEQALQLFRSQPLNVGIAAIAESIGQWLAILPVLLAPPGMRRLDHV